MTYLVLVGFFGLIWLFLFLRHENLRSCMVVSGLFFLPAGLTQALFVPGYWRPDVMFRLWGLFDAESLLFAFFTGGIAPALYPALFHLDLSPGKNRIFGYLWHSFWLLPLAGAAGLAGVAFWTRFPVIYAAMAVLLAGLVHMYLLRPDLIKTGLWGALLFFVVYGVIGVITVGLFPHFIPDAWNPSRLLPWRFLGFPVEEYVYPLLFGGLWSTVFCGVFNCRWTEKPQRAAQKSAWKKSRQIPA